MQLVKQLPLLAFWALLAMPFNTQAVTAGHESLKAPVGAPAIEIPKIKSYREWKSERVQEAIGRVIVTKTQIQVAKNKDPNLARRKGNLEAQLGTDFAVLEEQLQHDQSSLEIAKDLSVTDYFVGYLTKVQDKKAAFNEVAGKLTAEEVAELMSAYANSVFGTHTPEMPPSASNIVTDRVR